MKINIDSASESLKFCVEHFGLSKWLRKDATGSLLWVEQTVYPLTFYWSLIFGIEIDPKKEEYQKQIADSFAELATAIEKSNWFKEREEVWKSQNEKLIESLKQANNQIQELEKYKIYYDMQFQMSHGEQL